jgi:hypothetical protein
MNHVRALFLGLTAVAFAGGVAAAQTPAGKPDTSTTAPAAKLSAPDTQTWDRCKTMSHDAMAKDPDCARIVKAHPDIVKHDGGKGGTVKNDAAKPDATSNGAAPKDQPPT